MSVNDVKPCPLCRKPAFRNNHSGHTNGYHVKCTGCAISTRSVTREELPALVTEWNAAYNTAHTRPANIDAVDYWALKQKYDALVESVSGQQGLQQELDAAVDKNAEYSVQLGQLTAAHRYLINLTEEALTDIADALKVCPPLTKKPVVEALAKWKRFYENRIPASRQPAVPVLTERAPDTANPPKQRPVESLNHKARMERILFDYENTSA